MPAYVETSESRRRFLKWLYASPLLAHYGARGFAAEPPASVDVPAQEPISSPADAINVFDFEPVARRNVPPAHFGYMASGIDDEVTLRANRAGFARFQLRPRRLNDVSKVDTSTDILGVRYSTPIAIAPTGGNKAYHPDGEVAVARAAKSGGHLQILSTAANTSVEAATKERGAPIWFQLYASPSWTVAQALVKRAEKAGCPVVAVTVDRVAGRNQETFARLRRLDNRPCATCHSPTLQESVKRKPNYDGISLSGLTSLQSANMDWDFIKRLRDTTKMKILAKGILAWEDAVLAADNGLDGIIVSNHGARSEDNGLSTIEALPEIVDAVRGRVAVLVDSGFRRGTDIVKALAMGAQAVCIGRPYLWGLGAFGQPGVEKVLEILRTELRVAMQQCGVRSPGELTSAFVRRTW